MDTKKTESMTVRLSGDAMHFVKTRSEQMNMESPPEYIRHLVEQDQRKAAYELSLLVDALRVNDSNGISGIIKKAA